MKQWRRRAAPSIVVLGVALVASSAFAQARRYPAVPPNPGHAIPGAQAHAPSAPQAPDLTQANYRFLTIDPQDKGHFYIDAHGLNDQRQVVVNWTDTTDWSEMHASLWANGAWTSLDYVNAECPVTQTYLTSLNNREIAFGLHWGPTCPYVQPAAAVNVKTLQWYALPDIPDFPYNQGVSMSNTGLAAGFASNDAAVVKHWIWHGKQYVFPTFPSGWDVSGFWAGPLFINDWGEIAGQYMDTASGRMRGYLESRGKVMTFDAPGNPTSTVVNGMTNTGNLLVTANYDESSPYYPSHNFSLTGGVFTALPNVPFPDASWTWVWGLNDRGDISGVWGDTGGLWHAFVAFRK
jgi:hypothetical protein